MYQALYRQYRPRTFDDVLGQGHITNTIKNQINTNNIGHAYLFSGTRGTGKTSTAKIFSRAVNCLDPRDGNPCNQCEICRGILDESIMDVIEMDAASNRRIDDIRELIEKVIYPPSRAKYKVYIIDEVHMLTTPAFNALLKTLEEPPKHLIFILATTEPEKLPQTILSRCQRYDFKRVTVTDIMNNMKMICREKNINIEDRVLNLIARNADGAMRDALSLLDQCISFSSDKILYEDAIEILGIANTDILFKLVEYMIDEDLENLLKTIDQTIKNGKDINQFIKDLINHFRNLMICKSSRDPREILELDDETLGGYLNQANKLKLDFILNSMDRLTEAEIKSKRISHPRIVLETNLLSISKLSKLSIEERLLKIEDYLRTGSVDLSRKNLEARKKSEERLEGPRLVENKKPVRLEETEDKKQEVLKEEIVSNVDLDLEKIKNQWDNILQTIKTKKINVYAYLKEAKLLEFNNNMITIGYEDGFAFHKEAVSTADNKKFVEDMISNYYNSKIEVNFIMADQRINSNLDKKKEDNKEKSLEKVLEFFGEDLVEIKEE